MGFFIDVKHQSWKTPSSSVFLDKSSVSGHCQPVVDTPSTGWKQRWCFLRKDEAPRGMSKASMKENLHRKSMGTRRHNSKK